MIIGLLAYGAWVLYNLNSTKSRAFSRALSLTKNKGIANIGSGWNRTGTGNYIADNPNVVANIDMTETGPKLWYSNLENSYFPFADKQFDVSFASHVLEHIDNWELALDEWNRISDNTIIVLPHPVDISGIVHPDHKRYVSYDWINKIRSRGVEVFY